MKNNIILLVILIIALLTIVFFKSNQSKITNNSPIKIGTILPLTGALSSYGNEYEKGIRLAEKNINKEGGVNGRPIQVIIEDDMGDSKKSVTSAQKLLNTDNVKFLITALSSPSEAVIPLTKDKDVIHFTLSVSKLGDRGENIFRDYWDMEDQGRAIGLAIKKEGINKLGIIALNWADYTDFKKGLNTSLDADFPIIEEKFNFGDTDFKTQLLKIKSFGADGILVYGFPGQEVLAITRQIDQLGLSDKRLFSGATTYGFDFVYNKVSRVISKMKVIDTWYSLDSSNDKTKQFLVDYKESYKQDLYGDAAYPYDVLYTIVGAMRKSDDPFNLSVIKKNILETDTMGVAGPIKFDRNSNSLRTAYLQQFIDGKWVKYDK